MAKEPKKRREVRFSPGKIPKLTVAVVGIGRVGLPLALFLAEKGHTVYGLDIDQDKVNSIIRGQMPFMEDRAQELLTKYVKKTFLPTGIFSSHNFLLPP